MHRTRALLGGLLGLALLLPLLLLSRSAQAQALAGGYVAPQFRTYYQDNAGTVTLGASQTGLFRQGTLPVQYFEKGRLEDHSATTADPAWQVLRGRLTVDLIAAAPALQINGSTTTYGQLPALAASTLHAPPASFTGGAMTLDDDTIFIPFDANLRPAYGYIVPLYFWQYLSRDDLFPGGWMKHAGLPLSDIFTTIVYKDGTPRQVVMQPFERIVLTYDAANAPEWQVEQGNIGVDAMNAFGIAALTSGGPQRIEVSLARQWLYAYEGDELVFDAPVTTGRDGWETPTGTFAILQKLKKHDMRGRERGEEWDVPNVPNVMYFREGGFALHGTYWHNLFGTGARTSHGCVNLPLDAAEVLYNWAPVGTPVIIY